MYRKAPALHLPNARTVDEVEVYRAFRRIPPGSRPLPRGLPTKHTGDRVDKGAGTVGFCTIGYTETIGEGIFENNRSKRL